VFSPRAVVLSLCLSATPLVTAAAQQAAAPIDATKERSIRKLIELTHVAANMTQGMDLMAQNQRQANPQIPAAFWDAFLKKAHEGVPALVDSLVPIYARHFSQAELDQLAVFYATPLGQRLVIEQQGIAAESLEMGRKWGAAIGQQVGDSLQRAGGQ